MASSGLQLRVDLLSFQPYRSAKMVYLLLPLLILDLFQQAAKSPTSRLYKFQEGIKKLTGFTTPVVWARGVFNYDFGLMPWRHEINTVGTVPLTLQFLIQSWSTY